MTHRIHKINMQFPRSCDTFVVLPPLTKNGAVIFGKNSDRPQNEVQEVVYIEGGLRNPKLKCTYITIEESPEPVNTVILSKPAWMWGAEMGANDKNVVIGNEAVWTNNNEADGDPRQKRLLGMDLLRLGLERGNTADEALDVITSLLEKYGQGGPCSENDDSHFYHNSFLIADAKVAWVLETSGKFWAAERIPSGFRNISNGLTITTKFNKSSADLLQKSKAMGLWDGQSEFDFTKCFSSGGDAVRQQAGENLLRDATADAIFDVKHMFNILRHKESRICRNCNDTFPTQGSQVSKLTSTFPSVHWFTATPDPSISLFKPFVFTPNVKISDYTISPAEPKREHHLYKLHSKNLFAENDEILNKLCDMEKHWFDKAEKLITSMTSEQGSSNEIDNLMKECVQSEVRLYE